MDVAWAKANIGKPGIVFVDLQPSDEYLGGHIPGAVNSNFAKSGWREERASDKVPDMLPENLDKLVAHIGSLGIDNSSHVVPVPPGSTVSDMGWATRIYWTFKVLGHDNVSILNGGMAAYTKDKSNPLEKGATKVTAKTFTAKPRLDMVAMHVEDHVDPSQRVLHVFGRTYGQPHEYFYRRCRNGSWTTWEPVSVSIQGDHLAPVVWRERLFLSPE